MANKKNNKNKRNNRQKSTTNNNDSNRRSKKLATSSKQSSTEENVDEELNLLNEKMDSMTLQQRISIIIDDDVQLSERPAGLPNLGNTCYFNSIMQVMGQTYVLHHILKERCRKDYIWNAKRFYWNEKTHSFASESLHLKLPPPTPLIIDFLQLQQQIFQQRSPNPRALLRDVQREKHQFEGYAQQDAQELLITLLDALKKAESLRQQKSLIDALKIANAKQPSDEDRDKAQLFKITAKHTVVDAIFGGQLLSIIHCAVCDYRSFTFEPFIDLALSLDWDKQSLLQTNSDEISSDGKIKLQLNKNESKDKSSNKNNNKKKCEETSSEDADNDDKKVQIERSADEIDDDTPKTKKKRRQEKKAARRATRKQFKIQQQQQQNLVKKEISSSDEESKSEHSNNNRSVDHSVEREINNVDYKNEADDSSVEEDTESISLKKPKDPSHNKIKQSIDSETSSSSDSINSSTNLNKIDDDFRKKFYSFSQQRMSHMDDDYQNLDLGKLLRSFIQKETLDGPNKYLCENCSKINKGLKTYSKAYKCQLIALPPPILILQLKRFEASGSKRMCASMHKLNTKISFPEKLYLSPYTSRIYEHFSRFYEPECDPEDVSNMNEQRLEYTLYGVVLHSGSLRFGHYMAYVCVRPDSFGCEKLKRFLHMKPFISNIEHIIHVVHDRVGKNGEQRSKSESANDKNADVDDGSNDDSDDDSSQNCKKSLKRKWYFISDASVSGTTLESVLKDATSPYLLFYERTN